MKKQKPTSPKKYILTRARQLPLHTCYINPDWHESRMASILISRRHPTGHVTIGVYLTDLLALGVKDSFYLFNRPAETLQELVREQGDKGPLIEAPYSLVHNIIYGANAFAEDHGFKPHKAFRITQFILEEDTEDIELIDLEFGQNGKPVFIESLF